MYKKGEIYEETDVCMFALFLIANIGSAQARDDFSGKWVNSYGKKFLIHQYGSQAAMVMESNGNYLAIFNRDVAFQLR